MKKKLFSTALAIMMAGNCLADDVPALKITKTDGESTVVLAEMLSIKYTDTDMVVNMKDGTKHVFALDDIIIMELGQMPTDIRSIFADSDSDAVYTLTDINGKVIARGNSSLLTSHSSLPKGIYVITVGDKSMKILVK